MAFVPRFHCPRATLAQPLRSSHVHPKTRTYCTAAPKSEPSPKPALPRPLILVDTKRKEHVLRMPQSTGSHTFVSGQIKWEEIAQAGEGGVIYTRHKEPLMVKRMALRDYVVSMKRNGVTPTYPKDANTIVLLLDVAPGEKILDAGTGAGSMTLFLSRAVGKDGQVHTYERRPEFKENAEKNVRRWNECPDNVKYFLDDICTAPLEPESFDGVALDMVVPSEALANVVPALKVGRSLTCYLPNITQVVETVQFVAQNQLPLFLAEVVEVSHRNWDIRPPIAHPAFFQRAHHTAFLAHFRKVSNTSCLVPYKYRKKIETQFSEKTEPEAGPVDAQEVWGGGDWQEPSEQADKH